MRCNRRLGLLRREARPLDLGCGRAALEGLNHTRPLLSAGWWMAARLPGRHPRRAPPFGGLPVGNDVEPCLARNSQPVFHNAFSTTIQGA